MLMERGPHLTETRCELVVPATVCDQDGNLLPAHMPGERPLTVYLDKRELVTLMTLGQYPEALVLGYLRNQRLVEHLRDVSMVTVDWEVEAAAVSTESGEAGLRCEALMQKRTVTAGCGQGTQFGDALERLSPLPPSDFRVARSTIFALVARVRQLDSVIHKRAGAVHGCVLCAGARVCHVEHRPPQRRRSYPAKCG
ncbi:MAG: formate dehydrogenase accessory sulfurtransferase FdhD [Rhodocyclaceae bacterium]|nr:formate dehydrogenase accessory sulfurtransferase FdhD [Rhodocyclaceae bacterium]